MKWRDIGDSWAIDGVLGVLTALEAVRTIIDNGIELEIPLTIVNWTNEEGAQIRPSNDEFGRYH
ncbi:hypothetical protein UACE39S_04553 [Ureibacillus acetophenoni]